MKSGPKKVYSCMFGIEVNGNISTVATALTTSWCSSFWLSVLVGIEKAKYPVFCGVGIYYMQGYSYCVCVCVWGAVLGDWNVDFHYDLCKFVQILANGNPGRSMGKKEEAYRVLRT